MFNIFVASAAGLWYGMGEMDLNVGQRAAGGTEDEKRLPPPERSGELLEFILRAQDLFTARGVAWNLGRTGSEGEKHECAESR